MPLVRTLDLVNLRGIAGTLHVDFCPSGKSPTSLIIFGENGSGKSSIVDGVEFAARGRLSRRGVDGDKRKREVRNLAVAGPPGVAITLDSGERFRRGGGAREYAGDEIDPDTPLVAFSLCPVIIRRQDIETFWAVAPARRQDFFFDYFRSGPSVRPGLRKEKMDKLRMAEEEYARTLKALIDKAGPLPRQPESLSATKVVLKRVLLPKHGRRTGRQRTAQLPDDMWQAFQALQRAVESKVRASGELRSLAPESDEYGIKLRDALAQVAERVSDDFLRVTDVDWVQAVEISFGGGGALDIQIRLKATSHLVDPTAILNEAALDVLALLILLEVHIECARQGQSRVLILDDVFQSVDTVYRIRALDHVLFRLRDWQIVVTLHDRLWLDLMGSAMRQRGFSPQVMEVQAAAFGSTPRLISSTFGAISDLETALATPLSPEVICGATGRALEQMCDRLSISLGTSVTRRHGDKYTLADTWNGVQKQLKKAGTPDAIDAVASVDKFLTLRNLVGAHYNEWAQSISRNEATDFGKSAMALWRAAFCPQCRAAYSRYRPPQGTGELYSFSCKCAVQ